MVYTADSATRREIEGWATETTETTSYLIAYQAPIGAENAIGEESKRDADNREMLTVWEKSDGNFLQSKQAMSGQKPEYEERFEQITSDADAESLF